MKKNIKKIIWLVIGLIIGISTTVGAATVFNSKDITYSSSATSKTNVKDSLDELYTKAASVGQCPTGQLCLEAKISNVPIGSYISMTPTSTSYTISKSLTGYTSDQTINPSELNLWRVIQRNSDGTVYVVSEYVSSKKVYFKGTTGYMNFIGGLNTIAAQYTNTKYVSKTRYFGYSDQIETCTGTLSDSSCPGDSAHLYDFNLVSRTLGKIITTSPDGTSSAYWMASRYHNKGSELYLGYYINENGGISSCGFYNSSTNWVGYEPYKIRPILTLKANVQIKSGDGKSAATAYQLA